MKTKLTLTIEKEVIPKAKEMAQAEGISLSGWIEERLKDSIHEHEKPKESPLLKWKGVFQDLRDPGAARKAYLAKHFGLREME